MVLKCYYKLVELICKKSASSIVYSIRNSIRCQKFEYAKNPGYNYSSTCETICFKH